MAYGYKMKAIAMLFPEYIYHKRDYNKAFDRKTKKLNLCL